MWKKFIRIKSCLILHVKVVRYSGNAVQALQRNRISPCAKNEQVHTKRPWSSRCLQGALSRLHHTRFLILNLSQFVCYIYNIKLFWLKVKRIKNKTPSLQTNNKQNYCIRKNSLYKKNKSYFSSLLKISINILYLWNSSVRVLSIFLLPNGLTNFYDMFFCIFFNKMFLSNI